MPQKKTLEKYAQKPPRIRLDRTPEEQRQGKEAMAQMIGMASLVSAHMPRFRISEYKPLDLSRTKRTKPRRKK